MSTKPGRKPSARTLEHLFWAFFNNKMTVLLMMIENPEVTRNILSIEKERAFLNDIYHHFLPTGADTKYHRAFRGLDAFLARFPDVGCQDIYEAIHRVELIYEAFGRELPKRLETVRLERECLTEHTMPQFLPNRETSRSN